MAATTPPGGPATEGALATARLLWAACRPSPDQSTITGAIDGGADIELAARIALAQRVGPLLVTGMSGADATEHLGPMAEPLRQEYMRRRAQAELLIPAVLASAVEPLARAGLEPMVFKGPSIARRYAHPGLRPMDDLDLLLPAGYEEGIAVLRAAGWDVSGERGDGPHKDTLFRHPRLPDMPLELHRDIALWHARATHMTALDLWRARVPIECHGTPTFGLSPEDELVALAVHAGKPYHQFQRLVWSVDLAVLADTQPNWDRVASLARRYRCSTVVAIGLRHARRLGASVPDELLTLPGGRMRRTSLSTLDSEIWPLVSNDRSARRGLRIGLADSRRRQLGLVVGYTVEDGARAAPRHLATLVATGVDHYRRGRHRRSSGTPLSARASGEPTSTQHTREEPWRMRT